MIRRYYNVHYRLKKHKRLDWFFYKKSLFNFFRSVSLSEYGELWQADTALQTPRPTPGHYSSLSSRPTAAAAGAVAVTGCCYRVPLPGAATATAVATPRRCCNCSLTDTVSPWPNGFSSKINCTRWTREGFFCRWSKITDGLRLK